MEGPLTFVIPLKMAKPNIISTIEYFKKVAQVLTEDGAALPFLFDVVNQ